jgi:hypothetical protein
MIAITLLYLPKFFISCNGSNGAIAYFSLNPVGAEELFGLFDLVVAMIACLTHAAICFAMRQIKRKLRAIQFRALAR